VLLEKLDPEAAAERPEAEPEGKDLRAVDAGRKGGLKGGPARSKCLSAKKRKLIVKKGARARWENR
jgi:hypothetical protein